MSHISTTANIPSINYSRDPAKPEIRDLLVKSLVISASLKRLSVRQFEQNSDLEQAGVSFSHAYLKIFC